MIELVERMEAGRSCVNVHTIEVIDPADTGPGDSSGGEICGRIL